jgi:endonuclease
MAAISPTQREQVIALLREGRASREEIAAKTSVSPGTVSAIRAHMTMGTYGGAPTDDAETEELIEASETTFGLERDLQQALRQNIGQLEDGLRIVDGGKERVTEAGRIDITAQDAKGKTVIIELKGGTAAPDALTQVLAYMAVAENSGAGVRGILVAGDFHSRLRFAARAVPNVELRQYRFRFSFERVD